MKNHLLCFGLGYSASEIINELYSVEPENWTFSGTKRVITEESSYINITEYDNFNFIPRDTTHILISIPPKEEGDIAFNRFARRIEKLPHLQWLGYLSTTGVYGNYEGEWVDESSETRTSQLRSQLRLKAEQQWLSIAQEYNLPIHIFRLAGIYGPYRSELEKVISHKPPIIIKPNQFFSRIHVSDIAQIIIKSMRTPSIGEIYNLADDLPCTPDIVTKYAYALLNLAPPVVVNFEDADISEMAKSFYLESRKVSNQKVKEKLKVSLRYTSYKEGLEAIYSTLYSSER